MSSDIVDPKLKPSPRKPATKRVDKPECYALESSYKPTSSNINWALAPGDKVFSRDDQGRWWHPFEDSAYEKGGNTWFAAGPMTADTKEKMSRLWALPMGGRRPHTNSHVLGYYSTLVLPQVIVDAAFVDTMTELDPGLFDFTRHDKVWDPVRKCPPWGDGPYYIATVLPTLASYDREATELVLHDTAMEKYQGAYMVGRTGQHVRASTIAGYHIWRDTYTRNILCSGYFLKVLKKLGVREWVGYPVNVIQDGN